MWLFVTILRRIGRGILTTLFIFILFLGSVDMELRANIANLFLIIFKRKVGHVTPKGQPGEGGVWPEYRPPLQGDSRCSCPALNAMANHGSLLLYSFISSFDGGFDGLTPPPFTHHVT